MQKSSTEPSATRQRSKLYKVWRNQDYIKVVLAPSASHAREQVAVELLPEAEPAERSMLMAQLYAERIKPKLDLT